MEIKQRISNYEKMKNDMAGVFLQYDQEKMIQKFGLAHDESHLYISCLERKYRIDRRSGLGAVFVPFSSIDSALLGFR